MQESLTISMHNYVNPGQDQIKFPIMKLLLFTSLICSTDVIAAISIVSYDSQPQLYSCIFGEGIINDIVCIALFNTVRQLQSIEFSASTPFLIIGQFLALCIISVVYGILFGMITCLMFKHLRFLTESAVIETSLLMAIGFLSYFIAEITVINGLEMSGIVSLFTYAIISAHYTWYNLSH